MIDVIVTLPDGHEMAAQVADSNRAWLDSGTTPNNNQTVEVQTQERIKLTPTFVSLPRRWIRKPRVQILTGSVHGGRDVLEALPGTVIRNTESANSALYKIDLTWQSAFGTPIEPHPSNTYEVIFSPERKQPR